LALLDDLVSFIDKLVARVDLFGKLVLKEMELLAHLHDGLLANGGRVDMLLKAITEHLVDIVPLERGLVTPEGRSSWVA